MKDRGLHRGRDTGLPEGFGHVMLDPAGLEPHDDAGPGVGLAGADPFQDP